MYKFPFVISKRKSVTISAPTFSNALDRVLSLNPNKFIKTTFAKNVSKHLKTMDLINAQKQAKEQSKKSKGALVYVILKEDEFEVLAYDKVNTDKDDIYSVWRDGTKIEAPEGKREAPEPSQPVKVVKNKNEVVNSNNNKNENKMETKTKTKKKAAKKVAKKAVAKKAVAKKAAKKTNGTARKFEPGKVVNISIADMRKNMKKGFYYRDPQGVRQTEAYMATRAKQDHVRTGMHEYKDK